MAGPFKSFLGGVPFLLNPFLGLGLGPGLGVAGPFKSFLGGLAFL